MKSYRRPLLRLAAGGALLIAATLVWAWANPPQLLRIAANYSAKIVCSGVFLAGRDPQEVLHRDIQASGNPVLRFMRVSVVRDWARYGQFLLQQGVWRGQALLPAGYVKLMVTPVAASGGQYGQGQVWLWESDPARPGENGSAVRPPRRYVLDGGSRWSELCNHPSREFAGRFCSLAEPPRLPASSTRAGAAESDAMSAQPDLVADAVVKRFAEHRAVDSLSFSVERGSFFSILGPSGCGKTTLLRMIAGFIEPDGGDIAIGGKSMRGVAPNRRPVNMVFQQLALFPMMSVGENVAFGLARRGVPKAERKKRSQAMLERVGLVGAADEARRRTFRRPAPARCDRAQPRARTDPVVAR